MFEFCVVLRSWGDEILGKIMIKVFGVIIFWVSFEEQELSKRKFEVYYIQLMCLAQTKIVHSWSVGDLRPHSPPALLLGGSIPDPVLKLSRQYFTTIFSTSYLPNDKIPGFKSVFIEILEGEVDNVKKLSRHCFRWKKEGFGIRKFVYLNLSWQIGKITTSRENMKLECDYKFS